MAFNADTVALYWDFENLHASLADELGGPGSYLNSRFKPQDELIDVAAIIGFALSLGPIAINRAFANWLSFNRYKQALLQSAIELIQVFPPGANAKNGADIKLCLDVVDDMARFPHISTIIVVGGDSDYMPLSYKVKAAGRALIGIGSRRSTNQHWARSCHEFKFYQALVAPPDAAVRPGVAAAADAPVAETKTDAAAPAPGALPMATAAVELPAAAATADPDVDASADNAAPAAEQHQPPTLDDARALVRNALTLLARARGEPWVNKAGLRPYIQRMDPTFHESSFGYASFNDLLAAMTDLVEVRRGEHDHALRLRLPEPPAAAPALAAH